MRKLSWRKPSPSPSPSKGEATHVPQGYVTLVRTRRGKVDGFTKRYQLNRLVWIEHFRDVRDAIACEKKLKGWRRSKKIALVEQANPRWIDLSDDWEQQPKLYDRPWNIEEMIRASSPATAGSE
jgi:predicted GIY-YIG superfamily endonuclease